MTRSEANRYIDRMDAALIRKLHELMEQRVPWDEIGKQTKATPRQIEAIQFVRMAKEAREHRRIYVGD